jgi:hypothetical protein
MENINQIFVTKASGEAAPFSETKLRSSMKRAGATKEQINEIVQKISKSLYPGITTRKIYSIAFNLLRGSSRPVAARYHLKKGLMELGPSGFPFEKFIAEVLKYQGYHAKIGEIIKGKCVNHEIDIIAAKNEQYFMIECKYHNLPGTVCNVKIPLYIHSRFKDIEFSVQSLPQNVKSFNQGWLVTNTSFTHDAIQYGNCAGLRLLGWNYPKDNNLRSQIDSLGLYPITCLTSLSKAEKQILLNKKIVLCQEITHDENILINAGIKPGRIKNIMEEATTICNMLKKNNRNG